VCSAKPSMVCTASSPPGRAKSIKWTSRICPTSTPRGGDGRGFATAKIYKVELPSPHGFGKALEQTLRLAFTPCPPRGEGRQPAAPVAGKKNPNPGQAE